MSKNKETIERMTDKLIARMESGNLVWNKSWKSNVLPQNFITRKPYKGWNLFATLYSEFESPYYLTFNQITKLGGKVKKGSKGISILFWNISTKETIKDGETKENKMFFAREYTVFNAEQIEGIDFNIEVQNQVEIGTCEELESFIYNLESPLKIKHSESDRAFYTPTFDFVSMPNKNQFLSTAEYYSVLSHETIHATGHSSRLNRLSMNDGKFDNKKHSYSFEELVAEIGASYLNAMFGIATEESERNSAAYLQGWLKTFKENKEMLYKASIEAQKAVDYILKDKEPQEVEVKELDKALN